MFSDVVVGAICTHRRSFDRKALRTSRRAIFGSSSQGDATLRSPVSPLTDRGHMCRRYSKENFPKILQIVDTLKNIGTHHNATAGQVALAWLLAQADNVIPIPGSRNVKVSFYTSPHRIVLTGSRTVSQGKRRSCLRQAFGRRGHGNTESNRGCGSGSTPPSSSRLRVLDARRHTSAAQVT